MIEVVLENLAVVHEELRVPIVLENVAYYFEYPDSAMSEFDFLLRTRSREAGAGCCSTSRTCASTPRITATTRGRRCARCPPGIVRAAHVAGGTLLDGVHVDSHDQPVSEDTLALLKDLLTVQRPECVIIERDQEIDDVKEVLEDVRRVRAVVEQVWPS